MLKGKVALVTGASRGIGKAIAIELAKEGAWVIINYKNNDEMANKTLKEIEEIGGYAKLLKGDISSFNGAKEIADKALSFYGKIDILVNNAGISAIGLFMDANEEDIDNIINTNLLGPIYLTRHILPNMLSTGGNIINISSIWGETGAACEVLYSSSKGGINLFTKALAKEYAMSDIRVNGIAPGVIDTDMNKSFSEEEINTLKEEIPVGRLGLPEEIAKAVIFLCSDKCKYLTGQIIRIDGGFL